MNLTAEQLEAVKNGRAVHVEAPEIGGEVVVMLPSALAELLEEERERAAWAKGARKAFERWSQENPF